MSTLVLLRRRIGIRFVDSRGLFFGVSCYKSFLLAVLLFLLPGRCLFGDPLDNWTWSYPNPQGNALRAVTYGNGLFVAVGDYGTIIISPDGYNWTNETYGQFPALFGVGYAGGIYVAVGAGGAILTSSNGVAWTQQSSPTTNTLRAVAGNVSAPPGGALGLIAVGDNGTGLASADAMTWTSHNTQTTNNLRGVTPFANGSVESLVTGDNGTTITIINRSWVAPQNLGANYYFQADCLIRQRCVCPGRFHATVFGRTIPFPDCIGCAPLFHESFQLDKCHSERLVFNQLVYGERPDIWQQSFRGRRIHGFYVGILLSRDNYDFHQRNQLDGFELSSFRELSLWCHLRKWSFRRGGREWFNRSFIGWSELGGCHGLSPFGHNCAGLQWQSVYCLGRVQL